MEILGRKTLFDCLYSSSLEELLRKDLLPLLRLGCKGLEDKTNLHHAGHFAVIKEIEVN